MGLFDIFGTGDQTAAANAQIAGLNAGNAQATGNINAGIGALNTNYAKALQPFLQNYSTANQGVSQLGDVLGLNGPAGSDAAMAALQKTPGFQFQKTQGDSAVNAAAAANGTLNSGNQLLALSNYNQGLAGTTYNNYVSQLQPFLGASNSAAGGIANVDTGLGNAVAGQYGNLAGLNFQTQTGIGNANANKDLAGLQASGNLWNAIGSLGVAALGGLGNFGSSLGSMIGGAVPGAVGASSVGGAPLSNSLYSSIFSDERLKEDIEPVGELYDGTNVYRYRYKGDDTPRIGVMAQEVEKTRPDAVVEVGGFKAVDYGKATDLAASLARFVDGNVVALDDRRPEKSGYASDLSRFLDAA